MHSDERFPTAIVHFDGDSFFASVEQSLNHTLRGRPVVTGAERGAATSMSYEAKRLGLHRSMTMHEIRRICPEAVIVNSDYTAYSIYARRMYEIARRFTPHVQEYSIDECFADITDVRDHFNASYEEIARMIKAELERCLGITFGVGLAPTKVLAKAASKHRKPAGFTMIPADEIKTFLADVPIGKVWGVGSSMSVFMGNLGLRTALDFALKDSGWLTDNKISKPYREMWHELRGTQMHDVSNAEHDDIGSIMTTRTFSPPSKDRAHVFSQLSKNIERACVKARSHHVRVREITFHLKTQEFTYQRVELTLPLPTDNPFDIVALIKPHFEALYMPGIEYRATGISLRSLVRQGSLMGDLFGESKKIENKAEVFSSVDTVNRKYGRATVYLASSMRAFTAVEKVRTGVTVRPNQITLPIHQRHKTIDLPFLGKTK